MRRRCRILLLTVASVTVACGVEPSTSAPGTTTVATAVAVPPETAEVAAEMTEPTRIEYGDAPQQFADLSLPAAVRHDAPVVVLIHGGFWRNPYGLDLMEPLAADLVDRGYATWNIEYRRLGDPGGGWPGTLDDVATAVDALEAVADEHPLDLDRVAIVGHSAGGHLALWTAGREALPTEAPGASPVVVPSVSIGQGAVVDLAGAAAAPLGNGAVLELLGGAPDAVADRYEIATPRLDTGPVTVSVVGSADTIVPPAFSVDPDQPGAIELIEIDGADHFDLIDPNHAAWLAVVAALDTHLDTNGDTHRDERG